MSYFTSSVFYINESSYTSPPSLDNIKSYCSPTFDIPSIKGDNVVSRIMISDSTGVYASLNLPTGTSTIGPFNLSELQQYILTATTKILYDIQLAEKCDKGGLVDSPECIGTFLNFQSGFPSYNPVNSNGKYVPQIISAANPFQNFMYVSNEKKPLCQQYADMNQLLQDLNTILLFVQPNVSAADIETYMNEYKNIKALYQKNNSLRESVQAKFDHVTKGIYEKDSKQFLDSTVYVSVLWTILATTMLFYVFKKM